MMARLALWFSFVALGAAVVGLVLLGSQQFRLARRVEALENRPPPSPPPPPTPVNKDVVAVDPEKRREAERKMVREIADKENQAHFDMLAKQLDLEPERESKVREAFNDEFAFYTDGVVRTFEALQIDDPKPEANWMATPEFKKGLEERVAATDKKVLELLTAGQALVFEQWRSDVRKDRYELD